MQSITKFINDKLKYQVQADIDKINNKSAFTKRQALIFHMKYVEKHDINYIADMLSVSSSLVHQEIKIIKNKICKVL